MTELEQKAEEYTNKNGMPQIKQKCIYEAITKAYIKGYQDANQWVDCKGRLPDEIAMTYIVSNGTSVDFDIFDGKEFIKYSKQVTHWMPLPNKPLK